VFSVINDLDLAPYAFAGDRVDVLDLVGEATTSTTTRLESTTTNRRAAVGTVEGSAGVYWLNDHSVKVTVLNGPKVVARADGVTPSTADYTPAVIKAEDADGTTVLAPGSTTRFTNPTNPRFSVDVRVPNDADIKVNDSGTDVSATAMAFEVTQYGDAEGVPTSMGTMDIGFLYVSATVPVGGVDCTPPPDTDADGLSDPREGRLGTNAAERDTDGGGVDDGAEVGRGTDPLDPTDDIAVVDADEDGLDAAGEEAAGTDPLITDTDGDGLPDGAEIDHATDPVDDDSDNDRLSDFEAVTGGAISKYDNRVTDPNDRDSDNDGLGDGREINGVNRGRFDSVRPDPNRADTDRDGLLDGVEVTGYTDTRYDRTYRSHPLRADTDKDGLRDKREVTGAANTKFGNEPTNPWNADTDGEGVKDKREIRLGSNPADPRSGPSRP
jgi:hypothetical protein